MKKNYTIVIALSLICQPIFLKAQLIPNFQLKRYLQKSEKYKVIEVKKSVFNVGVFNPPLVITIDGNFFGVTARSNRTIYTLEAVDCTNGKIIKTPITYQLSPYVDRLGLICKQEVKLDKLTKVPLRFRLGSLDYVNWMEQKPNAIKPIR